MGDLPYFLTTRQVADFLQVSIDAVYTLIKTGRLRATNISAGAGKRPVYRIRRDHLEAFISAGMVVG